MNGASLRFKWAHAGPLPKVMPMSLEILNLHSSGKFTDGIPAEWGSMTNLKGLYMRKCGLDGESLVYVQADTKSR